MRKIKLPPSIPKVDIFNVKRVISSADSNMVTRITKTNSLLRFLSSSNDRNLNRLKRSDSFPTLILISPSVVLESFYAFTDCFATFCDEEGTEREIKKTSLR